MLHLDVNGKWLAQRMTGTQRYANEIVRAMTVFPEAQITVHVPSGSIIPEWLTDSGATIRHSPFRGPVFEQVYLPIVTFRKMLLNFAGPAPLLKSKQLVTMHDATPFRFRSTFRTAFVCFYLVMYYLLGRTARRLVTVSHFSARELHDVLGIRESRFTVAGCAADTLVQIKPRKPATLDGVDGPFYLMVGTLAVHKNLAKPVAAVADSGRTVIVVGASGNQQVFSDASPLGGAVVAGRLDDAELAWLYRNATALIFPSKYEGFGLPPLEAQTLGCPVVSSSAASMPEVAGLGAIYFDPDNCSELLEALTRIESDPDLAPALRARGYENSQRFSWNRSAETILAALGDSRNY